MDMPKTQRHRLGLASWSRAKARVFPAALMLLLVCHAARAKADAAFLMEEPFGGFGSVNPTGHAAVYLNHVCAETPTRLRICRPGEAGAVISRYHKINGYACIAIPLGAFLSPVNRVEDV